jgi:hypothetical protein
MNGLRDSTHALLAELLSGLHEPVLAQLAVCASSTRPADRGVRFLGLRGCCRQARPNGPDRLVGNHAARLLFGVEITNRGIQLPEDDGLGTALSRSANDSPPQSKDLLKWYFFAMANPVGSGKPLHLQRFFDNWR